MKAKSKKVGGKAGPAKRTAKRLSQTQKPQNIGPSISLWACIEASGGVFARFTSGSPQDARLLAAWLTQFADWKDAADRPQSMKVQKSLAEVMALLPVTSMLGMRQNVMQEFKKAKTKTKTKRA